MVHTTLVMWGHALAVWGHECDLSMLGCTCGFGCVGCTCGLFMQVVHVALAMQGNACDPGCGGVVHAASAMGGLACGFGHVGHACSLGCPVKPRGRVPQCLVCV
jgi:hypothetical protein